MDIDTVIPSLLIKAGGSSIHLGILSAIMLGGANLFQLVFAGYLSAKRTKKTALLAGINTRILSLFLLALLMFFSLSLNGSTIIVLVFAFVGLFSLSGAFANVSYVDILGKSVDSKERKRFFSSKQIVNSAGLFISALVVRELIQFFEYPDNFSLLFLCGGFLLAVASLGFWRLKEPESEPKPKQSLFAFFRMIPGEIAQNKNLKYYLLTINSLGMGVSILPFLILFAKDNFGLSYMLIGNFLLFRTIGMMIAGLILYYYANHFIYKNVLIFSLSLAGVIPVLGLLFVEHVFMYQLIFILSGIFMATYKVATNGVLLEISTKENRATYAGISGAGNLLATVFPFVAGILIASVGYHVVFISVAIAVALSYTFVLKLDCSTSYAEANSNSALN